MKIYAILESYCMSEGKPIAYLSSLKKAKDYIRANLDMKHFHASRENDFYYWHNTHIYNESEAFNKNTIEKMCFYVSGSTALKIKIINVE